MNGSIVNSVTVGGWLMTGALCILWLFGLRWRRVRLSTKNLKKVIVHMPGGNALVDLGSPLTLTGPATHVADLHVPGA